MLLIIAISLLIVAFYLYRRHQKDQVELRKSLHFDHDSSLRLRISVVATEIESVSYLASLLREESNAYQIIAVGDFSQREPLLRAINHYFGMFRVSFLPTGELPEDALRGVFRSHRRLYSKLIVVDSAISNRYSPLEVGTAVSNYDYILHLRSPNTLRAGAINNLLLELSLRHEGSVEMIVSKLGEGAKLIRREAIEPLLRGKHKVKRENIVRLNYNIFE